LVESLFLRGKFDVIGDSKDQLDAGDAVRLYLLDFGSFYSEGRMLTQRDAKTYWGTVDLNSRTTMSKRTTVAGEFIGDEPASASSTMSGFNEKQEVSRSKALLSWVGGSSRCRRCFYYAVTELDAVDYDDDRDSVDDDDEEEEEEDDRRDGVDWSGAPFQ
jgi:hypothetical protein